MTENRYSSKRSFEIPKDESEGLIVDANLKPCLITPLDQGPVGYFMLEGVCQGALGWV